MDAVLAFGPIKFRRGGPCAAGGPAPGLEQFSRGVKFEHGFGGEAAERARGIGRGIQFVRRERAGTLQGPDVAARVHGEPAHLAEELVIRKLRGPGGVNAKLR